MFKGGGQLNFRNSFMTCMNIRAYSYSKTRHFFRMFNFNLEIAARKNAFLATESKRMVGFSDCL